MDGIKNFCLTFRCLPTQTANEHFARRERKEGGEGVSYCITRRLTVPDEFVQT